MKDLFILDTVCHLNRAISKVFSRSGYDVVVSKACDGLSDEVLAEARGFKSICIFVNKKLAVQQLEVLERNGSELILCCSAGFDNLPPPVVIKESTNLRVARVPSYSPSSIAEYVVSSIFALSKNVQKSYEMTKGADFRIGSLHCLLLEDKNVGVIGTGQIGRRTAEKLSSLFCKVLCFDLCPDEEWIKTVKNAEYVALDELLAGSHVISLHVPLVPETEHMINRETISKMKKHVIIVNTSRGGIIRTVDLVEGLKSGRIFGAALDVFEGETSFMFRDMSKVGFDNHPELKELAQMDNVILSSHIAFYTDESIRQIARKTLENFEGYIGKVPIDEKAFVV